MASRGREQTGFDSTGDLTPLARQLGWTGEGTSEGWLRQQGYELVREDGLKGPNGRQGNSGRRALKDGQLVGDYLNEARPSRASAASGRHRQGLRGAGGGHVLRRELLDRRRWWGLLGGGAPTAVAPAATGGEGLRRWRGELGRC